MRIFLSIAISAVILASSVQPGYTGIVAIVDTGLDPGVLGGSIVSAGINTINGGSTFDDQPAQHGTSAAVSANTAAPNNRFIPVKAYDANFRTTPAALQSAFEYIATQNVHAASHNIGSITNTPLSALQAVTNAGIILVVQAGNSAAPNPTGDATKVPSLGGKGIIAGGIQNGVIGVASNRAGSFQDYYMVADYVSPINGWVGTSMATPRIAAVAAAVAETYSFLSPQQVVQILFDSAFDLGDPGVDAVYGHGAVDFNAAMSAVGAGTIPDAGGDSGGGGGGGGVGLALGALAVGGAVFYSINNKKDDLKKTIFVDKYGRGFNVDLSVRAQTTSNTPIFGLFSARQNPLAVTPLSVSEYSQTYAIMENPYDPDTIGLNLDADETRRIGFRHYVDNGLTDYAMGLNADMSGEFGALSFTDKAASNHTRAQFLYTQVFTTPILGYSSQGSTFKFGWNGEQQSHRLGISVIDDQEQNGIQSNSILYENRVEKENVQLGFQMGALLEDGNLLGGASDGAFSTDKTDTYYIGFNGSWNVSTNVALIGGYFQGVSQVEEADQGLLDEFSDIRTEGYGVGVMVSNVFSPRGNLGLSYSSPMQTTSGSATLTLPTSQDRRTGAIGFERSNLSFEGADQEKIFEAYYGYRLSQKSDVFAHYSYTRNPVSEPDLEHDNTFYVGWRQSF